MTTAGTAERIDRARGAFLGAALGDAAGWPQEPAGRRLGKREPFTGKLLKPWKRRRGTQFRWVEEPIAAGEYSDDTQLMLAAARSLQRGPLWSHDFYGVELPTWTIYERGGGGAIRAAARSWSRGQPPWQADDAKERARYWNAGGNGAATRVLPHVVSRENAAGSFPVEPICLNAVLTHGHPRAILGALVQGFALYFGFQQRETLDYGELIAATLDSIQSWSAFRLPDGAVWASGHPENVNFSGLWSSAVSETSELLRIASNAIKQGALSLDHDVLDRLGALKKATSGSGTVSAAAALFIASKYADNPVLAVQQAAYAYPADTDTIASMVGALMGSIHGATWLPSETEALQDATYIERLATECATGRSAPSRSAVTSVEIDNCLASIDRAGSGETVRFPDGRQGHVRETIDMRPGSPKAAAWLVVISLEDGQTVHVVRNRSLPASELQVDDPSRSVAALNIADLKLEPVTGSRLGIRITVRDMNRSRAFYADVMGLPVTRESRDSLRIADQLVLVKSANSLRHAAGMGMMLSIYTRNFDAVLRNVAVFTGDEPRANTYGDAQRLFRCVDPDNNVVNVVEIIESRESHDAQREPHQLSPTVLTGIEVQPLVEEGRLLVSVVNRSGSSVDLRGSVVLVEGADVRKQVSWPLRWDDWLDETRPVKSGQKGFLVLLDENGASLAGAPEHVIRSLPAALRGVRASSREPIDITVVLRDANGGESAHRVRLPINDQPWISRHPKDIGDGLTWPASNPLEGDVVRVVPPVPYPNTYLMVVEGPDPGNPNELRLRRIPDDGRPARYQSTPAFFSRGHGRILDTPETSLAFIDVAAFDDFFTPVLTPGSKAG